MGDLIKVARVISRFFEKMVLTVAQTAFLFFVRCYWGYLFILASLPKWDNMAVTAKKFGEMGIPLAEVNAYVVGSVEMAGGILLIIGLGARFSAFLLTVTMIVALSVAHPGQAAQIFGPNFKVFLQSGPTTYLFASLVILLFGPGKFSIDALIQFYFSEKEQQKREG